MLLNKNITKNPPLSSGGSTQKVNRKVNGKHSYTKSYFRDKDALPSYQDISSRVSTEIDTDFQSDENHHRNFWKVREQRKEDSYGKKTMKERINIKA